MGYRQHALEVTILSEEMVRRYARGELAPALCDDVEDALIQDDRVRDVIFDEAAALDQTPPPAFRAQLEACAVACREALMRYEILTHDAAAASVRDFAASRLDRRWTLFEFLRGAKTGASRDEISILLAKDEAPSTDAALQAAIASDERLVRVLTRAFNFNAPPVWKAKLAEWITAITDDRSRIAWLSSAFSSN